MGHTDLGGASPFRQPAMARVLFVNVNALYRRRPLLDMALQHHRIQVLVLNETHLQPAQSACLPGMVLHRRDHPSGRPMGGVAVAHRPKLSFVRHPLPQHLADAEALLATVYFPSRILHIATIYVRPRSPLPFTLLHHIYTARPTTLFFGDLNLSTRTQRELDALTELLRHYDLELLPFPEPTRPASGTSPDAVIVPLSLALTGRLQVLPTVGSDHLPVMLTVPLGGAARPRVLRPPTPDFSRADWPAYADHIRHTLRTPIPPLSDQHSVDDLADTLCTAVQRAADAHVPTARFNPMTPRLPPRYLALLHRSHAYLRRYRATGDRMFLTWHRQLARTVSNYIVAYKRRRWAQTCSTLNQHQSRPAAYWRHFRALTGQFTTPTYPIVDGDRVVITTSDKLSVFRRHFRSHFNPPPPPNHYSAIPLDLLDTVDTFPSDPRLQPGTLHSVEDHPVVAPITEADIHLALSTSGNTAPGSDGLRYPLLKHAPRIFYRLLAILYTFILFSGLYPQAWKIAIMLLFPKKANVSFHPGDYRPICLLSIFAKVLEKILVRRLHAHLSSQHLLPISQAGFRPRFSTHDQLLRLTHLVSQNFNLRHPTLFIALDFNKAFDTVWHAGLLHKLRLLLLPITFIRFIHNYLQHRTARIRIEQEFSAPFPLLFGVPQGSPLSPVLYSIYVADIPQPQPPISLLQYADDTAIAAPLPSVRRINQLMQPYLLHLEHWCATWRMTLNPDKTQTILFRPHKNSRSTTRNPAGLRLRLGGLPLRHSPTVKYLGVVFDEFFTFRPHFRRLWPQYLKRGHLLNRVGGTSWGARPQLLLTTYKAFVRPLCAYGHVAWTPATATNPRLLRPFVRHERARVRHALRLPRRFPTARLMAQFPLPPLEQFLRKLFVRHLARMRAMNHPYWTILHSTPLRSTRHIRTPLHIFREWDPDVPEEPD